MPSPGMKASELRRAIRAVGKVAGAVDGAISRAANRAATAGRAAASRAIRKRYRLKAADLREKIRIQRATKANPEAALVAKGTKLGLFRFGPIPNAPPTGGKGKPKLRVSATRGRRRRWSIAFVGTFGRKKNVAEGEDPGGRPQVAMRLSKKRTHLAVLTGPAVAQMMGHDDVQAATEKAIREAMAKRLQHEVGRALDSLTAGKRR